MSYLRIVILLSLLPALSTVSQGKEDWKKTIEKAVPYLQADGVKWMEKRGCVSCHQIPYMLWSLSEAHEHGFDVDGKKLEEWKAWSTEVVSFLKPERKSDVDEAKAMAANIDTMSALMVAIGNRTEDDSWQQKFAESLADNQKEDGSWKSCGQLPSQKRPKIETTHVTTLWTLLALERVGTVYPDSAVAFIDQKIDAKSTEWWTARMLLADARDETDLVVKLGNELLARQNTDGGWGWLVGKDSDAMATGMAIYALQKSGIDAGSSDTIKRATKFLVATQKANGSWAVPGTKQNSKDRPTPTANYWGTAWAVIGLLQVSENLP